MGYLRGETALDTTAWTVAETIKTVMRSETLTEAETEQLRGLLTEVVGDTELAEAYVSQARVNVGNANVDITSAAKDNGNIKPPNSLHDAKMHTDENLQKIIEEEGIDVNEFAALLDADRILTLKEKALVRRVLQKIGKPQKGTVMQKVVPEKDIQNILKGKYKTVRKSVAQASHVSKLKTLAEIYYGLRLDYDDVSFTLNDKTYGRIRYTVEDESSIDYSIDEPGYSYPYTGIGFLGTDKVVIPEICKQKLSIWTGVYLMSLMRLPVKYFRHMYLIRIKKFGNWNKGDLLRWSMLFMQNSVIGWVREKEECHCLVQ